MTSRLLLALVVVAGCTDAVPTFTTHATALNPTQIQPPDDNIPSDLGGYRWEVVVAPAIAAGFAISDDTAGITFTPPGRGLYSLDRWFVGPTAEELSCHVIVIVDGVQPIAAVTGPTSAAVGTAVTFDGTASVSREHLPLTYEWELDSRPGASTLVLSDVTSTTVTFVPDAAGSYEIALRVFDGNLWSPPITAPLTVH